jgi:flagellar biosynthesis anti-sigma factor FlgM
MRIGLNTPDPQGLATEKAVAPSVPQNASVTASGRSNEAFSNDTISLSALAGRALQTPEIRQDQVDSFRQQISSGQYQLDPHAIAEAMLSR